MTNRPSGRLRDGRKPGMARPVCPVSRRCGSCSQIDVPYGEQLAEKQRFVEALFAEVADGRCSFDPILGMERPFGYRDKIASPFASAGKGKPPSAPRGGRARRRSSARCGEGSDGILCGMYAAGTHRIVPVETCPVEHPAGREVVAAVRRIMLRYGMQPYDEDAGTGFMRHVVVRVGAESGEVLVTLVTNSREFSGSRNFCRELVKRCPQVTTVVQNVNTRATNAIFGDEEHVLFGPGFILDSLCGLSFRISSRSFYQVNSVQTEVLYQTAVGMAREASSGKPRGITVMDAYCGTGIIGLVAASQVPGARVIGVDKVESAIRDARENARHNGIENAEFVADDAGAFLKRMASVGSPLDVLMMDPPRSGASMEFLEAVMRMRPPCIVYISCNPQTQERDARTLRQGGYRLERIQPVDMFPHTHHVETVALMSRTDG